MSGAKTVIYQCADVTGCRADVTARADVTDRRADVTARADVTGCSADVTRADVTGTRADVTRADRRVGDSGGAWEARGGAWEARELSVECRSNARMYWRRVRARGMSSGAVFEFNELRIARGTQCYKGHINVVNELLSKDSSLLEISRSNGKNALHLAARQGHVDIVKALLDKDPQLARRTDKKGQTALHMAVKGISCEVVKLLLQADAAIVMLPDKFGNTALHVATRKKRSQIVNALLLLRDTNVNALTRDHKTALDIAEGLPLSEETAEIKDCLARYGAFRANELNQPRDELRKTVTEIKNDVHTQLEQARKTNKNMNGIAKELRKLHREGINNATNSVTVVAVLFATVAFAAIFTVPGGDDDNGEAVMVGSISFKVFFIFNAVALFTSLAVVLVQITVVRGEIKSERRVVEVINKLMWLASVCTTVAFIASSYIVVGRHHKWAATFVTVVGAVTMAGVLGTMTYYVVKSKRTRKVRKREKFSRTGTNSFRHSDISESDVNPIYAI
ncbi:ankyrin repeat family protein [Actinidia rufa]|uniref:Ankyrin repeat family protein n=1 Tax=Actinidia rufa TaxID=165716 RepID=A0A7J0GK03_9ERIC|nr:ankyrin repeat family protein [Actinidia rufa]